MAKASREEVERRIDAIVPLVLDCLPLRDIRTVTVAKTDWGATISLSQLKRYVARARAKIRAAASFDYLYELAAAKLRAERGVARASTKNDVPTYLTANRQLIELLGLGAASRSQHAGQLDIAAARAALVAEIAQELADHEADR